MNLAGKEQLLIERLKELQPFGVAFSGGVDSTLILKIARDNDVIEFAAFMGVAPVYFKHETDRGREFCRQCRIKLFEIEADFFGNASAVKNDVNRCYYCKKELFLNMKALVQEQGFRNLVDGTNITDLGDERPGLAACEEIGVVHPLKDCGLEKPEIRELARTYGIDFWDEPSSACLATRIPHGTVITLDKIQTIEKGELLLMEAGLSGPRLRHHGDIARIELRGDDLGKFTDAAFAAGISRAIKDLGFKYITIDLQGYRVAGEQI